MKRVLVILIIITAGCIFQQPPYFERCEPAEVALAVSQGETVEFSCTVFDPDTKNLVYTWHVNGVKVSDTYWYDFDMAAGDYTILIEVSDGKTIISHQWNVTVTNSPNFKKIQDRTERIRGLEFLAPVTIVQIDRDQLRENLIASLEEERNSILSEQHLYVALHILDPETDLYKVYIDVLTTQIASYYNTEDHTFYEVVDPDAPITVREFIAAHELVHALQDQYYYLDEEFENDDQHLAFLCVVEGDAMFHQYEYMNKMTYQEKEELFAYIYSLDIPVINPLLENIFALRYNLGLEFVTAMSFFDIDGLYQRLPVSTEQVMHPEKYMINELPVPVTVPVVPGWDICAENVLGEAIIKTILNQHINTGKAAEAAAGWGGDAYRYYEKGGHYLLFINTFWDTKRDATEFLEAYYNFTESWSNKDIRKIEDNIYETPTGFLALIQKEKQVIIIESPSLDAVTTALSLMGISFCIV